MEYSAGNNSNLLWFVETKETVRVLQNADFEEAKEKIINENLYQQKTEIRRKKQFNCIYKRISALPVSLQGEIVKSDLQTAKLIVLISVMLTDRLFFELVNEVYREKLRYAEEEIKESDINIFFQAKADQNEKITQWSEGGVRKLKQTYLKYMLEAGLLKSGSKDSKIVLKPYIEDRLRQELMANHLEKYLYALTGH